VVFVGYNVLTVEAAEEETGECTAITEPDDVFYCDEFDWEPYTPDRESVEKMCDASEDYAKNPKNCDKAYDLLEKAEEKAAKEDAICDNEDADTTDIKLCMSASRQQQAAHNYDKESCEQVNGDWNKKKGSGCTFYEDEQQDILDAAEEQRKIIDEEEQKALAAIDEYNALQAQAQQEEVIEDWSNTVSDEEQEKINAEAQYQQDKHEQLARQYTEEEQEEMNNALEEAASNDDESSEEQEQQEEDEPEQEEESEEDEPEEDNSDSESEE
jgi:hypothetical protein